MYRLTRAVKQIDVYISWGIKGSGHKGHFPARHSFRRRTSVYFGFPIWNVIFLSAKFPCVKFCSVLDLWPNHDNVFRFSVSNREITITQELMVQLIWKLGYESIGWYLYWALTSLVTLTLTLIYVTFQNNHISWWYDWYQTKMIWINWMWTHYMIDKWPTYDIRFRR